jgi:hypothetical protein
VDSGTALPFGGWARVVEGVVPADRIETTAGMAVYEQPWVDPAFGPGKRQVRIVYETAVRGVVRCAIRMDNPE